MEGTGHHIWRTHTYIYNLIVTYTYIYNYIYIWLSLYAHVRIHIWTYYGAAHLKFFAEMWAGNGHLYPFHSVFFPARVVVGWGVLQMIWGLSAHFHARVPFPGWKNGVSWHVLFKNQPWQDDFEIWFKKKQPLSLFKAVVERPYTHHLRQAASFNPNKFNT